ncbi:unnamed protein product [Peronospora belbahrii]|uniref:BHLH domain-containing protein n=1 Tax=Peronospora belbahrii TaxID=622444 RepID=A0AAU9KWM0_9STRA|nr:unnamed protein product [Peronospora belbahrii]CAH0519415.1 unnamed protein product [Peronospora belbahrii]
MLTPPTDYGYAPSPANAMGYEQHHVQSGERPKLFMQPPVLNEYNYMVHQGTSQHAMTPQHAGMTPQHAGMTPQHAAMTSKYESEPLLMNVQNTSHYYPPPQISTQMLHVSSDYEYANGNVVTPSSTRSNSKRSREDLNLKEKKRMFKLNDRINQLKDMLDEAGVQTKKNKQSILDNAAHYIEMLRSNLLIAKQKAERAEKQAEAFRTQAQKSSSGADKVFRGMFQKTTTPRVVVDMNMQTVTFNNAFVKHTGKPESMLKSQNTLEQYLCADQNTLNRIMKKVCETNQSIGALVKTPTVGGKTATVNLVAAVITDDGGKATNVEFSLFPLETSQHVAMLKRESHGVSHDDAETSAEESVTDGETKDNLQL